MKDSFYFQHDYNARNDERLLQIRAEHGLAGYALYFMLLESMAESSDGYLSMDGMAGLSLSYGSAIEQLKALVLRCIELGLFIKDKSDMKFTSKRMLEYKDFRRERAESGKRGAKVKWGNTKSGRDLFEDMKVFFNNTCVKCRGTSGLASVEKDHIKPTYQGGADHPSNWQPLCAKCNASKGPEAVDYRIGYCGDFGLNMPQLWLSYSSAVAKDSIVKDRKGQNSIEKEIQNTKSGLRPRQVFQESSEEFRLSTLLLDCILTFNPRLLKPDLQKWAAEVDKMLRIDKRSVEEIETLIMWVSQDSFWKANILSTAKLREKFDQLWSKASAMQQAKKPTYSIIS